DRAGAAAGRRREVCPPQTVELPLGALAPTAVAEALARVHRGVLPAALLRDVQRVAAGNPRYALDLARAGFRQGAAGSRHVPATLRVLVLDRLEGLSRDERRILLLVALADRPGPAELRSALPGRDPLRLLDRPLRAGMVELLHAPHGALGAVGRAAGAGATGVGVRGSVRGGGAPGSPGLDGADTADAWGGVEVEGAGRDLLVRFREAVVAAVLLAEASPAELAAARATLAATAADPVDRARLTALARPGEADPVTGAALAAAADRVRALGDLDQACDLALLAIGQVPAGDRLAEARALVAGAESAVDAGRWTQAATLAARVLPARVPAATVPARTPLAVDLMDPMVPEALAPSVDPARPGPFGVDVVALRARARVVLLRVSAPAFAGARELIAAGLAELPAVGGTVGEGLGSLRRSRADGLALASELHARSAEQALQQGDLSRAMEAAQAALTAAGRVAEWAAAGAGEDCPPALAPESRAAALAVLAAVRTAGGDRVEAHRALDQAADLLDRAWQAGERATAPADRGRREVRSQGGGLTVHGAELDRAASAVRAVAAPVPDRTVGWRPDRWDVQHRLLAVELEADRPERVLRELAGRLPGGDGGAAPARTAASLVLLTRARAALGEAAAAMESGAWLAELLALHGEPLSAQAPPTPLRDPALIALATAELVGGRAERAGELARRAVTGCAASGDRRHQVQALALVGEAGLLLADAAAAAAAVEALQEARRLDQEAGLSGPATVRRRAALVEGLVVLGEHAAAAQVLREGRAVGWAWAGAGAADAQPAGSVGAALDRAAGLAQAGAGDGRGAAALLRAAAGRLRAAGLPLEVARTLVALGSVERRSRHRSAARAALLEAQEICAGRRAAPLLARVERELERLDQSVGVPGSDGALLTASEHRMAGLAADGASNREVAAALFVSVKTVEGTLSRVYRKLGVRSRAALARALATYG
ncbi:helix-turn-helix transcriptional regulator, partial [Kitasatospora nipponensis]|uniref:helix-turn-helix transcriptional regulator n=1 Tax=Kitasatospora nipponensis TaxID=258049 RepID=UPI0031E0763F